MTLIADIATGHTWGADLAFLLAVIAAALAAVVQLLPARRTSPDGHPVSYARFAPVLVAVALALVALGLLLL